MSVAHFPDLSHCLLTAYRNFCISSRRTERSALSSVCPVLRKWITGPTSMAAGSQAVQGRDPEHVPPISIPCRALVTAMSKKICEKT